MNKSKHHKNAFAAFDQVVKPYLQKKMGHEIATMLTEAVQAKPMTKSNSAEDTFNILCRKLLDVQFDGHAGPFLNLVLERDELYSLPKSFAQDYESLFKKNRDSLSASNAFTDFLVPDLIEVLGEELVTYVSQLYTDAVELQVGVADHVRFLVAMDKVMDTVSLLSEVEYVEKIKTIAQTLKDKKVQAVYTHTSHSAVSLQDGIKHIIIPDLAGVLGYGSVLKTLIESTRKECTGIFPDELTRFSRFVKELNKSDIILNMFGDYWTSGKEREWIKSFKNMST